MREVIFGIVGTGKIAGDFVRAARVSGAGVAAVFSRTQESGARFAAAHGIPTVCTDYDAFCRGSGINAVYVASPNYAHCGHTLAALRAGCHVLCEKPFATDADECRRMFATARASGRVLMEAMRPAHDPAIASLAARIADLGSWRRARFVYRQYSSRYDDFKAGIAQNAFNPRLSNAAVMDIGVYCIAVCLQLLGMPERLESSSVFLHNGMEGEGSARFFYGGGAEAELCWSKLRDDPSESYVEGNWGRLSFVPVSRPRRITLTDGGGNTEELPCEAPENNMIYEIGEFISAVRRGAADARFEALTCGCMNLLDRIRAQNGISFD